MMSCPFWEVVLTTVDWLHFMADLEYTKELLSRGCKVELLQHP